MFPLPSNVNSASDTGGTPPAPRHSIRFPQSPVSQCPAPLQLVRAQIRPAHPSGTWNARLKK
ncbi:hypothetical protein BLOT_003982 [Blomia tropicalis]|nr:hypothetical protein BLOT_003982 [Blomia tropicalis]